MSTDTNIDMRRITETDKGFHVRFYSPQKETMWFPVGSKDKEKVLSAALRYRNRRERELGLSKRDYGSRRPRARHANSKADDHRVRRIRVFRYESPATRMGNPEV